MSTTSTKQPRPQPATTAKPSTDPKLDPQAIWSLADTRASLESLLRHMHNATQLVDSSITADSSSQLHKELNAITSDLASLRGAVDREVFVNVPSAVIDSINQGINPATVTSNLLLYGRKQNDSLREKLNNTYIAHQTLKQGNQMWRQIEQRQQQKPST